MNHDVLDRCVIRQVATIQDVAATISRNKLGFALVVDVEGKLVGTVTDGDLRRAYLANRGLETPVSSIMCSTPVVASVGSLAEAVVELAKRHRVQFVPLVDDDGRPIDVALPDGGPENPRQVFKTAVIMAGGEGHRLRPLTDKTPKPMLQVNGKPILEHIVGALVDANLHHIYLSVNYMADVIIRYFGDGRNFGAMIEYLQEKEKLGTAGSLSLLPSVPDEPVLVMNGDVMTNLNYSSFFAFHIKHRGVMTVAATEYKVRVPFGTLDIVNQFLTGVIEKPEVRFHCNAGVYALDSEAFQYIPANRAYDMTTLMSALVQNGLPVSVFPIHEYWVDVGSPEDLETAKADVTANRDHPNPRW
jgi:dTDP-glucose pyrophosphorylase